MTVKQGLVATVIAAALAFPGVAAAQSQVLVYKDAACGCCNGYIAYLQTQGIDAVGKNVKDIELVKKVFRVPEQLESCHTMAVGGYVIEGHVPMAAVRKLLMEGPDLIGIGLPVMPLGAPGMNGEQEEAFKIYGFSKSGTSLYMTQ